MPDSVFASHVHAMDVDGVDDQEEDVVEFMTDEALRNKNVAVTLFTRAATRWMRPESLFLKYKKSRSRSAPCLKSTKRDC